MTESEWLACNDPTPMLEFLGDKTSKRKLRLFACACCRRIWPLLPDLRSRAAVEMAERHAEGDASHEDLQVAWSLALEAYTESLPSNSPGSGPLQPRSNVAGISSAVVADVATPPVAASYAACRACGCDDSEDADESAADAVAQATSNDAEKEPDIKQVERTMQLGLLKDIAGNPFRPVILDPVWLTSTVTMIAQAAYDHRILPAGTLDPDRLAVLADALEDAGCTDTTILGHLRGPGPHCRGCFAVDLVLGKE